MLINLNDVRNQMIIRFGTNPLFTIQKSKNSPFTTQIIDLQNILNEFTAPI